MTPVEARQILEITFKNVKRIRKANDTSDVIASILLATQNAIFALEHLDELIQLNAIAPVQTLFAVPHDFSDATVDITVVNKLLASDPGIDLLTELVRRSPRIAHSFLEMLRTGPAMQGDPRLLPAFGLLLHVQDDAIPPTITTTALKALLNTSSAELVSAAITIIVASSRTDSWAAQPLQVIEESSFNSSIAALCLGLVKSGNDGCDVVVEKLLTIGVRAVMSRLFEDSNATRPELLSLLSTLSESNHYVNFIS